MLVLLVVLAVATRNNYSGRLWLLVIWIGSGSRLLCVHHLLLWVPRLHHGLLHAGLHHWLLHARLHHGLLHRLLVHLLLRVSWLHSWLHLLHSWLHHRLLHWLLIHLLLWISGLHTRLHHLGLHSWLHHWLHAWLHHHGLLGSGRISSLGSRCRLLLGVVSVHGLEMDGS